MKRGRSLTVAGTHMGIRDVTRVSQHTGKSYFGACIEIRMQQVTHACVILSWLETLLKSRLHGTRLFYLCLVQRTYTSLTLESFAIDACILHAAYDSVAAELAFNLSNILEFLLNL